MSALNAGNDGSASPTTGGEFGTSRQLGANGGPGGTNTGGGGGGGSPGQQQKSGGSGGSGAVIIRYKFQ